MPGWCLAKSSNKFTPLCKCGWDHREKSSKHWMRRMMEPSLWMYSLPLMLFTFLVGFKESLTWFSLESTAGRITSVPRFCQKFSWQFCRLVGWYYSYSAAREEGNYMRNFWRNINRTSSTDLMPPAVLQQRITIVTVIHNCHFLFGWNFIQHWISPAY